MNQPTKLILGKHMTLLERVQRAIEIDDIPLEDQGIFDAIAVELRVREGSEDFFALPDLCVSLVPFVQVWRREVCSESTNPDTLSPYQRETVRVIDGFLSGCQLCGLIEADQHNKENRP